MKLLVLPGDGIGPEITDATLEVLQAASQKFSLGLRFEQRPVGLAALKTYDGSSAAADLLSETPLVLRLMSLRGQVKSSMLLANANGAWRTVQIGDATRALAIASVTNTLTSARSVAARDLFLVKVPGLGLDFLAYRSEGSLMLAPLFDSPQYSLQAGQAVSAEQVFASLVVAARTAPAAGRGAR